MQSDQIEDETNANEHNSIVSAICWVKRGYAKAVLQEYEPTQEELQSYQKMSKKLLKGKKIEDINEAKKEMEKNLVAAD